MQLRFAVFQVLLGVTLVAGAFTGNVNLRGFDYLPQTPAYRVVFFVLGAIAFFSGLHSLSHLHS